MYVQLYYISRISGKKYQLSIDNFTELQTELERLNRPKFITIVYFNDFGKVMISKKYYSGLTEKYNNVSKVKYQADSVINYTKSSFFNLPF